MNSQLLVYGVSSNFTYVLYIAFQVFSTLVFISAHPTFLGFYGMVSSRVLDTLEATIQLETWAVIFYVV